MKVLSKTPSTTNRANRAAMSQRVRLLNLGLFVSFCIFVLGCFTLYILMNYEEFSIWTQDGVTGFMRKLLEWNPMVAALFLNGGLLGMIYCLQKIYERKNPEEVQGKKKES